MPPAAGAIPDDAEAPPSGAHPAKLPAAQPRRSLLSEVAEKVKGVLSTALASCSLAVIVYGISHGHAVLPGVPPVHFAIFVFVVVLLGYLEGLQVAILALEGTDGTAFKDTHPRAHAIHRLVTKGKNVQRFLVGRQFYVIFVVFLCAQVTTFPTFPDMGMPGWLFVVLIDTGLPGALIVLAFGQLMPQLIASKHPVEFMNIRLCGAVVRMALFFENLGVTHFSWVLTSAVECAFFSAARRRVGHSDGEVRQAQNGTGEGNEERMNAIPLHPSAGTSQVESVEQKASEAVATISDGVNAGIVDTARRSPASTAERTRAAAESPPARIRPWTTPQADQYPTPSQVLEEYKASTGGSHVPRFLLPPLHADHIPPHVVAVQLMSRVQLLEAQLAKSSAEPTAALKLAGCNLCVAIDDNTTMRTDV